MKRTMKKVFSFLLTFALVFAMGTTAFGTEYSYLTFVGGDAVIDCAPDSIYTSTDLFNGFKGVMPGDERIQTITVKNNDATYDKLMLYLRMEPHGDAAMIDFLAQMQMTIWHGNVPVYSGSAAGTMTEIYYLGSFAYSTSTELTVQLNVPIEMDSTYAGRMGEVDWIFSTIGLDDDPYVPPTPGVPVAPDAANVTLYAAKTVNGEKAVGSDYSFQLKDGAGVVLQTVKNYNGNIIFDTLHFTDAGTHIYTISEVNDGAEGVTYDNSVYIVTVKVTEDTTGNCRAEVTYQKDGRDYTGTMVFSNKSEVAVEDPEVPKDEPEIEIDEPETPKTDKPKTGDDTVILPYVLLLAASAVMMLLIVIKQKKQKS